MPRLVLWLALAALVTAADLLTKAWALASFHIGERHEVTGFFNFVLVMNHGAAFGFLAGAGGWQKWFFVTLAAGISVWLVLMIRRHANETRLPLACALVLGGAIGNVIDRLRFGAVVDFLDFHVAGWHWPAFNLADAAIVGGVALLLWHEFSRTPSGTGKDGVAGR